MSTEFVIHDMYTDIVTDRFLLVITIPDCPRCGKDHDSMIWHELRLHGEEHNCWAMCPWTMEPLLAFIQLGEDDDEAQDSPEEA